MTENILTSILCVIVIVANLVIVLRNRACPFNYMRIMAIAVAVVTLVPELVYVTTNRALNSWFSYALFMALMLYVWQAIVSLMVKRK